MQKHDVPFSNLLGLTLSSVTNNRDEIIFETVDGRKFEMSHNQDCCESVTVEDIAGDLQDLVGSPIVRAEENTSDKRDDQKDEVYNDDVQEWTFYRIQTAKGLVVIRWYGTSNGYYSTSVDFNEIKA